MSKFGYAGKMLRVNLKEAHFQDEKLEDKLLETYIGGVGIGAFYLYQENPTLVDWFDPRNRLILCCGPLNGTSIRGSGTICFVTKAAMTNLAVSTQANGYMGAYIKSCGYDGIILQGSAKHWSYLLVTPEKQELRDASHLLGKDSIETQELIKSELNAKRGISIQCIGPAGEKKVRYSILIGDGTHTASKGGVGAILASKKIKAIVILKGRCKIQLSNPDQLKLISRQLDTAARANQRHTWGTNGVFSQLYQLGCLPVKNYTTNIFPGHEKMNGQYVRSHFQKIRRVPCFNCGINHNLIMKVTQGPYSGFIGEEPEYESFAAFGPQIGQLDAGAVFILSDMADRLGIDVNEAGWVIGWLMECYEKGLLLKNDLDGIDMKWGSVEAAKSILKKISSREGIGDILAEGVKRASARIGRGTKEMAVCTKNYTTPRGHDHRGRWSQLLDNCFTNTSNIEATFSELLPEKLGLPPIHDKFSPWEVPTRNAIMNGWHIFEDCLGMCRFNISDYVLALEAFNAATGLKLSIPEVLEAGKRIINTLRVFNIKNGYDPKLEVPCPRYASTPTDGPNKGKGIMDNWNVMRQIYYSLMGWDAETGKPYPETLRQLGLQALTDDINGSPSGALSID